MTAYDFVVLDRPQSKTVYRGLYCGTAWPLGALSDAEQEQMGIVGDLALASNLEAVKRYVRACAKEHATPRLMMVAPGRTPSGGPPDLPSISIGHDVCIPSFYSLVHQSVLLGVPEGTPAVSLRPALNRFGLFDELEDAERLRAMWKANPDGFDVFGVDDVDVLRLYWVLSIPGCDVELAQPDPAPSAG